MMLNIFSFDYLPSIPLALWGSCSNILSIFNWAICFHIIEFWVLFIYILWIKALYQKCLSGSINVFSQSLAYFFIFLKVALKQQTFLISIIYQSFIYNYSWLNCKHTWKNCKGFNIFGRREETGWSLKVLPGFPSSVTFTIKFSVFSPNYSLYCLYLFSHLSVHSYFCHSQLSALWLLAEIRDEKCFLRSNLTDISLPNV